MTNTQKRSAPTPDSPSTIYAGWTLEERAVAWEALPAAERTKVILEQIAMSSTDLAARARYARDYLIARDYLADIITIDLVEPRSEQSPA